MVKLCLRLIFFGLLLFNGKAFAQLKTHHFQQIDSLQKREQRPVVVFIHTDWCRYCQAMKNTTFKDEKVISLLNDSFYFIDFNGEEKRNIPFNGQSFAYKPYGVNTGVHELAEYLGNKDGRLSYPAISILNADSELIFQYHQFVSSIDLLKLLYQLKP